jgi:methyl-accepting chemotaxis protein
MDRRPSLSIRLKLLASFGVGLVLMLVLGAFAISQLGTENAHVDRLASKVVPASQDVGQAGSIFNKYRKDQLHYVLSTPADRAGSQGVTGDLAGDLSDMSALLASYTSHGLVADAKDAALLHGFQTAFNNYVSKSGAFKALADNNEIAAAGAAIGSGAGDHAFDQLKAAYQSWSDYKTTVANAAAQSDRSAYSSSKTLIVALLLAALAISAAIALVISRRLSRSIAQIGQAASAIAKGDVDQRVEVRSRDELGSMAEDFNEMVEYLKSTAEVAEAIADGDLTRDPQPRSGQDALGQSLVKMTDNLRRLVGEINAATGVVNDSTEQMATTSKETGRAVDEVAAAIGQVASGAERQVHSIAQARRVADEVAAAADSGAAMAQETAGAAARACELATGGAEAVTRATEAMRSVRESSVAVTSAIAQLGNKSDQIGGIVRTITDIAEQTNMLALNAAIEAARAGERGRGFAVVAEEVRKLAEESQGAAASISTLIGEIQSETASTVAVVEDGGRRTEDGTKIVDEAREAFLALGSSVTEMSGRVDEIARVVEGIAASAQVFNASMAEAAAVAEESSAATEQVSASSEETSATAQSIAMAADTLASTADELSKLVGRFQLAAS